MERNMVKKWKIAPFLNKGTKELPDYFRIKKSTAFDLSMNPETQEYDYIADESPTTELLKYKPSLNQALTMYKGEPDYDFVFKKFFNMDTGSDAETDMLLVFFQESKKVTVEGEEKEYYLAWNSDCIISINDLNSVDSTLTFDVFFNGTVAKGYVELVEGKPVFTEGEIPSGD